MKILKTSLMSKYFWILNKLAAKIFLFQGGAAPLTPAPAASLFNFQTYPNLT